jgi:transglutaminase-like putative cysteine protease/tetratricopeptide (TPR) repeat protein
MGSTRVVRETTKLVVCLVVVGFLVGPVEQAAAEVLPDAPEEAAGQLLEGAAGAEQPAVGVAKTRMLDRLRSYLVADGYPERVSQAAEEASSGLVEFRLRRRAVRARLNLGDFEHGQDGMEGPLGGQGCLTGWRVAGPFDNDSMNGWESRLGPEAGETGPYEGKRTEINWRPVPDLHRLCAVNLGRTVEPATSAVAYLAGEIEADQARSAVLLAGAVGAYKIWVDGEPVAKQRKNLGFGFDQRAWKVQLEEGSNDILVKLGSRSDGQLAFAGRLVDEQLAPISGVEMTPRWSGDAVDEIGDDGPEPTGDGIVAQTKACARGEGSSAAWCAWSWSRAASALAATPWRDAADELVEPAMSDDGSASIDGGDLVRLSGVYDDYARRLRMVEQGVEMAPESAWARLQLAEVYGQSVGQMKRTEKRRVLEELAGGDEGFWPATVRLADWYDENGFGARALDMLRGLSVDNKMRRPAVVRRLVGLEQANGQRARAEKLRRELGGMTRLSGGNLWKRLGDLASTGEIDRALEEVRMQRKLHPYSSQWGREEVDLLRAKGKDEEALATLDALIDRLPGDAQLRRRKAELLVALNRADQAIPVLETATDLRPQDDKLSNFLARLRPDEAEYYEPWMIEDVRALSEEHPGESFAHDTLIDQTIFQVEPSGLSQKVVQRVDRAHTSNGVDDVGTHSISYRRGDEQIEVLGVNVYKSDGRVLEDYDKWHSGSSRKGSSTYSDRIYLNLRANNVEKGDLVEFRYRVREIANENFRGDYFGDISYVQQQRPIAYSRYVVEYPATRDLYFREPSLEHTAIEGERPNGEAPERGYQVRGFEMSEIPAVHADSRQPGHTEVYDYVMVSNKETYAEIGEWWWNLIEEQLIANDAIKKKAAELTEGLDERRPKIEAIHNYVVKNTRYLHLGLGVHGWKPYKTTECFSNKYGDCKDKSSLLKVMLEEAGIPAHLVLVRTRDLGTVDERPASMHVFNHAIVYIPSEDLFLDPTAEFNGTKELTPMDQGAQALIVEDGGEARMTELPIDEADDNLLRREIEVSFEEGTTTATGHMVARGQNAVHYRKSLQDPARRDEVFEKQLSDIYPGAELVSARYKHLDGLERPVEIEFEFEGGRIARQNAGETFVFPYGAPKDLLGRFAGQARRNQDLTIRVPFANETTMTYRLPEGRGGDEVPESVDIDSQFGGLSIDYSREGNTLVADIRYSIGVQQVPVEEYGKFRSFLSEATSALNNTIPLTNERTK